MKKSTYIFILLLLAFGYFNNIYTNSILTRDVNFLLVFAWGAFGWIYYQDRQYNAVNNKLNIAVPVGIMAVLIISPLLPMIQYDQPYLMGAIAQRNNYVVVILLVLLRMRPTEQDILKPMQICSFITFAFYIISIFKPELFVDPEFLENSIEFRAVSDSTDIGYSVPGFDIAVFYLFFKLTRLPGNYTKRDVAEILPLMALVIMMQNRSTLLGLIPLLLFIGYKLVAGRRWKLIIFATLVLIVCSPFLIMITQSLLEETESQLLNDTYTRWIGIKYFTVEKKDNVINILFGNGFCGKSGRYAEEMLGRTDIFISDIGWLGTYYYYGAIVVLILLGFALYSIFNREIPVYLRFYSLWILLVPTIHCFLILDMGKNILYIIFFYLVMYHSTYHCSAWSEIYGFISHYCKLQHL